MKKIKYKATIVLELTRTVTDEQFNKLDLEAERKSKDNNLKECIEFNINDYLDMDIVINSEVMEANND